MQFWKTTISIVLISWSALSTGLFQTPPDRKRTSQSNNNLELGRQNEGRSMNGIGESMEIDQEPLSIDDRHRTKRTAATAAGQDEILRIHNILRRKERASDMYNMRWNNLLASMAGTWATGCNFVHGQPSANRSSLGYQGIGQNLYAGSSLPLNWTLVIQNWFSEKQNYGYGSNSCTLGKNCGHYKQVVWSTTYEIGCGYAICPVLNPINLLAAVYVVCNYGPEGNVPGKRPYQFGAACSNCSSGQFYCNNGLCDKTCTRSGPNCTCLAVCQNCGNVTSTCGCKCSVGWSGNDCSRQCKDTDARCGASPGWPASWCSSYSYVSNSCPVLCNQCVAGNPLPCVTRTPGSTYVTIPLRKRIWEVPSGLGNATPPARACLCVQGTNIAVRSAYDVGTSILRLANTGDCFRYQGIVETSGDRRWYKVNAAAAGEETAAVDGWIDGLYLTQAMCPTSNGATCYNPNERFNNSLATCCLEAEWVWTFSSGGCADPSRPECTSLNNIRCKCLEELVLFRRDSQATTRIVEGTEVGGDTNHTTGYMLSLERNQAVLDYITRSFYTAGYRASDGASQWTSPRGNTWILDALAWDVYCP